MNSEKQSEQTRINQVILKIKQKLTAITAELNEAHFERAAVEQNYGQNAKINTLEVDDQMETNAEVQQQKQLVAKNVQTESILQQQVKQLRRLSDSPYFGRIDICEPGDQQPEKLYIGTASFVDSQNNFLVYDWRAPISSIYYNGTLGSVNYQTPAGQQQVELLKKRQFKIKQGKIRNMFDTNETVGDSLLQDLLSEHSDQYMHNIVATIQQEQNSIIRDTTHDLLLVQGVAGSGKTSAVLQRVAFLLYHSRQDLVADQMVLFSPNYLFSNYISEVLPSLGEKNLRQVTLHEFFSRRFEGLQVENLFTVFEARQTASPQIQNHRAASGLVQKAAVYAQTLPVEQICFVALNLAGESIISARTIKKLYQSLPVSWSPALKFTATKKKLLRLIKKIGERQLAKDWVTDKLQNLSEEQIRSWSRQVSQEPQLIEKQLRQKIVKNYYRPIYEAIYNDYFIDSYQQYSDFLLKIDPAVAKSFANQLEYHQISWENCAPLLMLRDTLTGSGINHQIKYLFIDEMQDYSVDQLLYLKHAFPKAKFTLLGDSQQALYTVAQTPQAVLTTLKDQLKFKKAKLIELNKSYRSTFEITDFIQQILPTGQQIQPFNRHGQLPQVVSVQPDCWQIKLLKLIKSLQHSNQTLAVITQTQATAIKLEKSLQSQLKVTRLTANSNKLEHGVIVLPIYLAKGLEFDGVIVFNTSQTAYPTEKWSLLYTACSRAMHQLVLFSIGQPSKIISQINTQKYLISNANTSVS
ncbi:RNA polymerase recycling motor HelD [Liquorilactobacillus vini]|uniref:ATP-dependent DNA helicase n=1 Tax=Liquorilactobacillus vini DSM 20605 TaxID=1133569 RepID=A0A0R2C939_9LACO|nr:RNA polymerase recycling motor HelD [Liquorilactobacillus vini]KRM84438.1 ATP-dependent DNA helicase [Liquorilactobacillus vini DSM 20605]